LSGPVHERWLETPLVKAEFNVSCNVVFGYLSCWVDDLVTRSNFSAA
jgi:hypothetical protein